MTKTITEAFAEGVFAITLLTHDLDKSREFYGVKLELPEIYSDEVSTVYKTGNTMINILSSKQADELLSPDKLTPEGSGTDVIYTIKCDDVDAVVRQLQEKGVELTNGPMNRPWGVRTANFQDPSGHTWELASR